MQVDPQHHILSVSLEKRIPRDMTLFDKTKIPTHSLPLLTLF